MDEIPTDRERIAIIELYNTETEFVEAIERMTRTEAYVRNKQLRENNEPHRWIPSEND